MAKKKDKDFQKVKIKVGRKLKRQNETVVDLTTKKIRLPKERDTEKDASEKHPKDIFDEAVASLDLEKSSAQLQAIQSLNRILDPFVRQMSTLSGSDRSSTQLSRLVAIFRALFHLNTQDSDLSVQLGTLVSGLHRLCRAAQDSRLGPGLIRLAGNLLKILSIHPKYVGLLGALDGCAITLLQRPESSWLWVGCQLAGLVLQAHAELVSACAVRPETDGLFDGCEQLVRASIYSRALMRLNNDLREKQSIVNASTQRTNFIRTALAFFKDHQYTLRSSIQSPSPPHPWILARPKLVTCSELESPRAVDFPLDGYTLQVVLETPSAHFVSLDPSLIEMESSTLLRNRQRVSVQPAGDSSAKKRGRDNASSFRPPAGVHSPLWLNQAAREQEILVGVLEHGIDVLGELSISISEPLLDDLYGVLRLLRVFFESKPLALIRHGTVTQGGHRNISVFGTLCRFCQKLYSQCTIRPSDMNAEVSLLPNRSNATPTSGPNEHERPAPLPPAPPPGSTRQEIRRWQKRMAKLRNRQERRNDPPAGEESDTNMTEEVDQDKDEEKEEQVSEGHASATGSAGDVEVDTATATKTQSGERAHPIRRGNHPPGLHRVNQALLELLTLFELCSISPLPKGSDSTTSTNCWPPSDQFLHRFAIYLLDDLFPTDALWPLPVVMSWLRSFDLYLLASVRSPSKFRPVTLSQRLLSAPVITALGNLLRGLTRLREQQQEGHLSLTRNQHRLYARVTGLLTATLSTELIQARRCTADEMSSAENSDDNEMDTSSSEKEIDYDDAWIERVLTDQFQYARSSPSVCTTLVESLSVLVQMTSAQPRVLFSPALSTSVRRSLGDQLEQIPARTGSTTVPVHLIDDTWAQCLTRLVQCRFSQVLRLKRDEDPLWLRQLVEAAERRIDRMDHIRVWSAKCGFPPPEDASNHLGWVVSGYLPSLDGRYASAYFWQPNRDSV